MPIYEFKCKTCGKRSAHLLRSIEQLPQSCSFCNGKNLQKLISRFAMLRTDDQRMVKLSDPSNWGGIDENDPKSITRWVKKMGKEMGEDMGEDFDRMAEEEMEKPSDPSGTGTNFGQ